MYCKLVNWKNSLAYSLIDSSLCQSVIRHLRNPSKRPRKLRTWINVFNRIHITQITHIMIWRCFVSIKKAECSHQKLLRVKWVASFELYCFQTLSAFELMAFKSWTKMIIPVVEITCFKSWYITGNWLQHTTAEMMRFFPCSPSQAVNVLIKMQSSILTPL